jgi:hypothetical protein
MMTSLTKFTSPDGLRICIYSGSDLVAEFQNNDLGTNAYETYLLGRRELCGQGVYDADAGMTETFPPNYQVKLDGSTTPAPERATKE